MKYLILLLILSGCSSAKIARFTYDGINWECRYNIERMNCHNRDIPTRYIKKPINPREL